jgi:DNA-binding FadR family transcriptional regulator
MVKRKADQVAEDLLSRIVAGEIPVGSLLPREAELAARYGVNRSVVREAVKKLEVHRLLRPVRRKGTVVLDPFASLSPEVIRAMLAPRGRRVDRAALAWFLEIRAVLDAQMNALAALRRTDEDLARLEDGVERLAAALGSPRRYSDTVREMTLNLARATGNRLFEMLVRWQSHIVEEIEDLFLLVRLPTEAHLQGWRLLVDAIRRRDAGLAREIAERFHEWATPTLLGAVADGKESATWK